MAKMVRKSIGTVVSLALFFVTVLGTTFMGQEVKAASYEKAWFPMSTMNLTQLAYETYSHGNSMHIDCIGSTYAVAPFTGTVKYSNSNYGVMIFQSNDKVYYADGSLDYMTVMYMHGTCLYGVGSSVKQGTNLYKLGGLGANGTTAYGVHLDLGVYKGQRSTPTSSYSRFGDTFPYKALYINSSFTTYIANKGKAQNSVNYGAPTDYSNLWKYTTDTVIPSTGISVTYQTYDSQTGKWLPNVVDRNDYAGVIGHPISAVYANLSSGNITYQVHVKGGSWLPAVKNRSDYAGIYSKPIDGIMMKTDTGKTIHYRVHIQGGNWLSYVTGYNTSDGNNGYAGIFGNAIDAIQIYVD